MSLGLSTSPRPKLVVACLVLSASLGHAAALGLVLGSSARLVWRARAQQSLLSILHAQISCQVCIHTRIKQFGAFFNRLFISHPLNFLKNFGLVDSFSEEFMLYFLLTGYRNTSPLRLRSDYILSRARNGLVWYHDDHVRLMVKNID